MDYEYRNERVQYWNTTITWANLYFLKRNAAPAFSKGIIYSYDRLLFLLEINNT
jgi:hypothetical protein